MQLAERSSLQDGDVMSVLTQLSGIIAGHLHEGRTVSIDGLGNFFPTISSEGVEKPEINKVTGAENIRFENVTVNGEPFHEM